MDKQTMQRLGVKVANPMKLLTKTIEKKLPTYGQAMDVMPEDLKVRAKFFNPVGRGTWYACTYDPDTELFFGFVSIFGDHCDEAGSFSRRELEEAVIEVNMMGHKVPFGIERDMYFDDNKYTLQDLFDGKRP